MVPQLPGTDCTSVGLPHCTARLVPVPKGTSEGRIVRVRGRGVPKRSGGHGDPLVTVKVAVPPNLEGETAEAYAKAERADAAHLRPARVGQPPAQFRWRTAVFGT